MSKLLTFSEIRELRGELNNKYRLEIDRRLKAGAKAVWLPGQPVPGKPIINDRGDVLVIRPFDLWAEIEAVLKEEEDRAEAARIGVPYVGGAAAGTWTFTDNTRTYILDGTFDVADDTFKMALLLSTSNIGSSSTTHAGVTDEHANNNGYTTGGITVDLTLSGTTTVTVDIATDPVWTASGGPITARFAEIYEVSGNVLCYALLDSTPADVTATDGNTLTVAAHASGVFTLS